MADLKISELPSATALSGTEPVPIVQGAETRKITVQDIADLAPAAAGSAVAQDVFVFFPGNPGGSQLLYKMVASRNITFPANFAGARGDVGVNPASSFVMSVSVAGATVGSITVSTGGLFTFSTDSALPVEVLDTEVIEISGPSSADGSVADIGITIPSSLTE